VRVLVVVIGRADRCGSTGCAHMSASGGLRVNPRWAWSVAARVWTGCSAV